MVAKFPGKRSSPGLLEMIEQLENDKQTISSQEQLDGLDVVVYRLTKDNVKSTIWADRYTMLPCASRDELLRGPSPAENDDDRICLGSADPRPGEVFQRGTAGRL